MRTTPAPDIEGMVNGGETRLRRRNTMRIGLAAAAVLLVGGGVYGATQLGDDGAADSSVANQPGAPAGAAVPPSWQSVADDESVPDPGTFRVHAGFDADGNPIEADLTLTGSGWEGSNHPVAYDGTEFAGVGVYRPEALGGGCRMEEGHTPAAAGQQRLAAQLASLPRSTVVAQPERTQAFGHSAIHVGLLVDAFCDGATEGNAYVVAEDRGISYFGARPGQGADTVRIDFWVVDVDGTAVVVDMFHTEKAPEALVGQVARAMESVTFVTE